MRAGVGSVPVLQRITPAELKRDCPSARIVAVRHRGAIYRQGDAVRDILCLLDGQATLARVHADGAALTTAMIGAGDFFGPALGGAAVAEDTARAKGPVSVWRAPMAEFRNLLSQHPDASWEFFSTLARRQRQMERRLEGFAFKRV